MPPELPEHPKKWCLKEGLPVYSPNSTKPVFSLIHGNVVIVERICNSPNAVTWSEITRTSYSMVGGKWVPQTNKGWVNDFYLDDYNEGFPDNNDVVKIENPTQDPNAHAKQYMVWEKTKQVNMCGELCVAYIVNNEIEETSLESVLEKWKQAPNKGNFSYNLGKIKEGLIKEHLNDILQVYDALKGQYQPIDSLRAEWNAALNAASFLEKLKDKLKTHYLIALVTINSSGALIPKAETIKHWVVVEEITWNGWGVKLYNPFPNKFQKYSLEEFSSSCHNSGLWVKRKTPVADNPVNPKSFMVALDVPKPSGYSAEQYIDREGEKPKKKLQLCGEFCVAYILGESVDHTLDYWNQNRPSDLRQLAAILSAYGFDKKGNKSFTIGTVLDYWKRVERELYDKFVGNNQPTAKGDLKTILRAYGYAKDDYVDFSRGLHDPFTANDNKYFPSPGRMQKMLKEYFLIAGVAIDSTSGMLINRKKRPQVAHWVVVDQIDPVGRYRHDNSFGGNGGWVVLYNPFMNRREEYSYQEFTNSMGEGKADGLWVKRKVQPGSLPWKDLILSSNSVLENLGISSLSQVVNNWISDNSGMSKSFPVQLALVLRETGVLVIKDNNGDVSEDLPADPAISGSHPTEKVANLIGRILARKAHDEIKRIRDEVAKVLP